MTIKQLTYFLKIAETGSFSKSAQLLNISQPPLSYQLKLLEEELGVQLFLRDSRNVHITAEGKYLQNKAVHILDLVNKTISDLKDFSSISPATITIGTVSSINHNLLPDKIREFRNSYPNTIVNIYDGSSIRITELLDSGIIDFGIIRDPFNHDLYASRRVRIPDFPDNMEDYFIAAGVSKLFKNPGSDPDSIPLASLAASPLIIHRRFEENFLRNCQSIGCSPNIISRNDNIVTSIEWAENGLGIAIMPLSSSLLINDPHISIKKIVEPVSSANLFMIWNKNTRFPISIMEFMSLF